LKDLYSVVQINITKQMREKIIINTFSKAVQGVYIANIITTSSKLGCRILNTMHKIYRYKKYPVLFRFIRSKKRKY